VKRGDELTVAFIIGAAVYAITVLFGAFMLIGGLCKRVGTTYFGVLTILLPYSGFTIFYVIELAIFYYSPHAWGISCFFIALRTFGVVLLYISFIVDSAVFTDKHIYRLTKLLLFKKYSYQDVIGYVMKKTSGMVRSRFRNRIVLTYDVEIYLNDGKCVSFSTRRENDKKIVFLKDLLIKNNCAKKGRPL